jgi:uncharacterized protein (DUF2235 family)
METELRFQEYVFHQSPRRFPRHLVLPFHQNICLTLPLIILSILRDSVNSVGLFPQRLPFTITNSGIRVYRHAISLDERRAKFKVSMSPGIGGEKEGPRIKQSHRDKPKREKTLWELEHKWSDPCAPTDVLEVWFSGK